MIVFFLPSLITAIISFGIALILMAPVFVVTIGCVLLALTVRALITDYFEKFKSNDKWLKIVFNTIRGSHRLQKQHWVR